MGRWVEGTWAHGNWDEDRWANGPRIWIEDPVGGRGRWHPAIYRHPLRQREDDIEEQLEDAARLAMLQQLVEARGVQRAKREYEKRIEDARALSLMSAQRNAAVARDPLHRPLPVAAATFKKELGEERRPGNVLSPEQKLKLETMQRDGALAAANTARDAERERQEQIKRTRLDNLKKARKASRK